MDLDREDNIGNLWLMIVKDEEEERPSAFGCDMFQVWKMPHLSIQQEKTEQIENLWLSFRELKSQGKPTLPNSSKTEEPRVIAEIYLPGEEASRTIN